jgi:hypothetical protein
MGRCIIHIKQWNLPKDHEGMLITSYDEENDCFDLRILISSRLCTAKDFTTRCMRKVTMVHEFIHVVATLSAIARVRSKELIERLRTVFQQKVDVIQYADIEALLQELDSFPLEHETKNKQPYFSDEHFRLGFEDFPISYPDMFEELLLSEELFKEYFPSPSLEAISKAISKKDAQMFKDIITEPCTQISEEKALNLNFVLRRVINLSLLYHTKSF